VILGMRLDKTIRALVYNHRGMAHFSLGDYRRALHDFTQAIRFDRNSDRGYANRGLCYREKKQFEKALSDYNAALACESNRANNYLGRAQTYYCMFRYEEALDDCRSSLVLRPNDDTALELIATIRRSMDQIPQSIET